MRYQIIRGYGKSNPYGTEFSFDDKATIDAETSFVFRAETFALVFFWNFMAHERRGILSGPQRY